MRLKLKCALELPHGSGWSAVRDWIAVVHADSAERFLDGMPGRQQLRKRQSDTAGVQRIQLTSAPGVVVEVNVVSGTMDTFTALTNARQLVVSVLGGEAARVGVCIVGLRPDLAEWWAEKILAALLAGMAVMPTYKSKQRPIRTLRSVCFYGVSPGHKFERTFAEAAGNDLARTLTYLPGNELTPANYRCKIERMAERYGWYQSFHDLKALKKRRAGAFLAVAQGSPDKDAGILHLRYQPKEPGSDRLNVALVGKGICFATGGVNLKPEHLMRGMHKDMQGSAVALGSFLALTRLKVDFAVECWLALASSHISLDACKPNDVVHAANGTSIEIVHPDAEGRMVLADTLLMASESKPALIIDYATLTGACKNALGSGYSGIFTSRSDWVAELIAIGRASGERVWPFPLDSDFGQALQSTVADVKQCGEEGQADHIVAAKFLQRFVDSESDWLHIDLASGTHKGGLGHVPTDITGFGVRFTLHALLDSRLHHRD